VTEHDKSKQWSAWTAWGSVGMAALSALALALTVFLAQRALSAASTIVVRGEGDVLGAAVTSDLLEDESAPRAESLARALEKHRAAGLRYVALMDRMGGHATEAGEAHIAPGNAAPGAPTIVGDRARMMVFLPPPRRFPRGTMPHPSGPPPFTPGAPPPGIPRLVIEYEPPVIRTLRSDLTRISVVAGVAGVVLMGFALSWSRSARRLALVEQKAERERRLVALGSMSSVMAHELRNPLSSLKGHAQLLLEDLPEGKLQQKAERVVAEARRLEELTTSLLDFVRDGPMALDPMDTKDLVEASLEHLPKERVQVNLEGAPVTLRVDRERMVRALHNLLQNALQATDGEERVEVRVMQKGAFVNIEIRDHGPGVAVGDEDKIFEPFVTTRVRGTGLGLPVARRIAEQHRGTLGFHNDPQGGAVFTLRLPSSPTP
jgi:two-component system, NtrC family, sensor histidine kinase HydH